MIPPFRVKLIFFDIVNILYERDGDLCFRKRRVVLRKMILARILTKSAKNDIIQTKMEPQKEKMI